MIPLHPQPGVRLDCPFCQVPLDTEGWLIPGMRNLAELACPQCRREFYGDLPAGHGLLYPMLLEKASGDVYGLNNGEWFREWLRTSYAHRVDTPVGFSVEDFRPLRKPILLNCLDGLYGHCVLKLLNAQHYIDHRPDLDLILLVPAFLRWMVPEGAAAVWTVDLPLQRGMEWNDRVAEEIKHRISSLKSCGLSIAPCLPHPQDFDIERFTRISPFSLERWAGSRARPTVTFIWREDRVWGEPAPTRDKFARRVQRKLGRGTPVQVQKGHVIRLAEDLRRRFPGLEFAVAGLGTPGGFPDWIQDLRVQRMTAQTERDLCRRYAQSHVVIGIHGSNMLLPSAHAGATVELVPDDRWGNLTQDILPNAQDSKEAMVRYQFLSEGSSPAVVSRIIVSLLHDLPVHLLLFERLWERQGQEQDFYGFWKEYRNAAP